MEINRIKSGVYKCKDSKGVFIITGGEATVSGLWVAFQCETHEECRDDNSWAVQFKTKKQLLTYASKF